MVWWLSQGRSPEGVAQVKKNPKMVGDEDTKLLDGVSGKACSGGCSGGTNTQTVCVVLGWIVATLLHQG